MTSASATASGPTKRDRPAHFEPHIQGLRAIAVALVVLYHVWPGRITGGFIGVDVFFVISGYLITGQLVRELDGSGRIRLGTFWAKRIRRLLPAALLVLVVCAILMLTLMPLSALWQTTKEIVASSLYVENWALVQSSADYLGNSDNSPVQHYWSLSLEEQFYIVWPLLLLLASWIAVKAGATAGSRAAIPGTVPVPGARRHRAIIWTIAVVTIVSFVICGWYTALDSSAAYFTTYTRMWEFGIGAFVTLLPRLRPRSKWMNAGLGWAGLLLIVGPGLVAFTEQTVFPGWIAAIPVVGTALVIMSARADAWWLPARWLSFRPARWVGDISYSLYLWHWPLIIVAPYIPGWGLEWTNRVALIVVAVLLAWATKRLVEDPFRGWRRLTRAPLWRTFAAGAAMMAISVVAILGVNATLAPVYDAQASELQATVANPPDCFGAASAITPCSNPALAGTVIPSPGFADADGPGYSVECFSQLQDASVRACHFGSDAPGAFRVALVGDSHAFQYTNLMISLAQANGWSLTIISKGACPWSALPIDRTDAFGEACRTYQTNEDAALAAAPKFDAVVTTAFIETDFASPKGGGKADAATVAKGYEDAWASLGAPVVAIRDNPRFEDDPNKCLKQTGTPDDCTAPRKQALGDPDPIAMAAEASGAQLIDLSDTYCDATNCRPVVNGANVYRDRDHLTVTWTSTMAPLVKAAILAAAGR